jgi:putative transposase
MQNKRRNHGAAFKAKVALAAVKGDKTIAELATEYQVHPTQITQWKNQLLESLPGVFTRRRKNNDVQEREELTAQLYQQIGRLKVELDWLKKNLDLTLEQKRMAIEPDNERIPIYRQCELLCLSRSSLYYTPCRDTRYNERLMKLIDEQYMLPT